jgi:hypothetical protein
MWLFNALMLLNIVVALILEESPAVRAGSRSPSV